MTDLWPSRTRLIDAVHPRRNGSGIRQAVILASGLDARGYRLSWPAGTVVFEIDQQQVTDFKTATLAARGRRADRRPARGPGRSARRLAGSLAARRFRPERPTVWVAEGLLAFLPPEAQDRLLDNITALSADGSRLVAEVFLNSSVNQEALNRAFRNWGDNGLDIELANLGFPGERNDVATYLEDRGWHPVRTPLNRMLADHGQPLQPVEGPDGQEAPFARNYYCTAVLHKKTGPR